MLRLGGSASLIHAAQYSRWGYKREPNQREAARRTRISVRRPSYASIVARLWLSLSVLAMPGGGLGEFAGGAVNLLSPSVARVALGTAALVGGVAAGLAHPGVADAQTSGVQILMNYGASGWKYQQVASGTPSNFFQAGFNDSSWPTGSAGFGDTLGDCAINHSPEVRTNWDRFSDMLLRYQLPAITGSASVDVTVSVAIDNDVEVWLDAQPSGKRNSEGCANYAQTRSPSCWQSDSAPGFQQFSFSNIAPGPHTLAVRAYDRTCSCVDDSFVDVQVSTAPLGSGSSGIRTEPAYAMSGVGTAMRGSSPDPVDTLTGSFTYARTDLALPGNGPTPGFSRAYNSIDARVGVLGPGWTASYSVRLRGVGDASRPNDLLLVQGNGRSDRYTWNTDGSYTAPPAVYTRLTKNGDGTFTATATNQSTVTLNSSGSLTALKDRFGNTSTLTLDGQGRAISVSDPAGRGSLTLSYDTCFTGRLCRVSDWSSPSRSVQYGYDTAGRLTTVTDRNGKVTTYAYDGTTSHLSTITDANAHVAVTNHFDVYGRVDQQWDALNNETDFTYASTGTTVTLPASSFDGKRTTMVDAYDANGRLSSRVTTPSTVSGEAITTSRTWDGNWNLSTISDGRGNTTTYCYDTALDGTPITPPMGNLTRIIQPGPSTGATPLVTLSTYNGKNNPTQTIAPKGVTNGTAVTCSTNLSASIAGNGLYATNYTYDATLGTRLLSLSRAYNDPELGLLAAVTKLEYGDAASPGRVTRTIPPRGNMGASPDYSFATTYTYNSTGSQAGLLASVTSPLGQKTTYTHDAVGRVLQMVDALANAPGGNPADHTWSYQYDNEDRLTQAAAPAPEPGGSALITQTFYDAVGNRLWVKDPNGQVSKSVYDARDSLQELQQSPAAWTDPATAPSPLYRTVYSYDALGNLVRVDRAAGDTANERVTDYSYDGLNRARKETQYPDVGGCWPGTPNAPSTCGTIVSTVSYDLNSNRSSVTDPLNQVTSFTYDALNRPTGISYGPPSQDSVATPNVTYTYDADSNRTSMADGTGTTTYAYDELERVLSLVEPGSRTVAYRYDLNGNRRKQLYPDTTAVTYQYDEADRLQTVQDWANRLTAYQYQPDGKLQGVTNANNTTAQYVYDNARRLTDVWHQGPSQVGTIDRHTYTLDGVGNRTRVDEVLPQLGIPAPMALAPSGPTSPLQAALSGALPGLPPQAPLAQLDSAPEAPDAAGTFQSPASSDAAPEADALRAASVGDLAQVAIPTVATPTLPSSPSSPTAIPGPTRIGTATTPAPTVVGARPAATSSPSTSTASPTGSPTPSSVVATPVAAATPTIGPVAPAPQAQWRAPVLPPDATAADRRAAPPVDPGQPVLALVRPSASSSSRPLGVLSVPSPAPTPTPANTWAWGDDYRGQLGDGTTTNRSAPQSIAGLTNVSRIASGTVGHSLAVKTDGTVWAWGRSAEGQLGDGTRGTPRSTPVQVLGSAGSGTLSGVSAVAAGGYFSLALKTDGSVWAWGSNWAGQLGNGSTADIATPVQVSGLANVTAIAAGDLFGLALKSDGTVWAWGRNDHGQLGTNSTSDSPAAVQVQGLPTGGVAAIAAGGAHALAAATAGGVWSWGENADGQLGDGTTTERHTAVQAAVLGFGSLTSVAAGTAHSLALKSDGTVWA